MLPHLHNGWQVDQAILSEEERVIVVRFGHDWDPTCMQMDEILYKIAEPVSTVHHVECFFPAFVLLKSIWCPSCTISFPPPESGGAYFHV